MSTRRLKAQDIKVFSDAAGAFFEQSTLVTEGPEGVTLMHQGKPQGKNCKAAA